MEQTITAISAIKPFIDLGTFGIVLLLTHKLSMFRRDIGDISKRCDAHDKHHIDEIERRLKRLEKKHGLEID